MPTPHRGRPAGSRKAPRSRGSMPSLEVITMGRVGVDLYPEQIGVTLAEVRTFAKSLGGSPTNVAVAAARLGRRAAVITKVGDDGFGVYVRRALAEFGVDARWVGTDAALPTPLVFCEIFPPDRFPVYFYREPKAPDMNIARDDLDLGAIAAAPLFWTTGSWRAGHSAALSKPRTRQARSSRLVSRVRMRCRRLGRSRPSSRGRFQRDPTHHGAGASAVPVVAVRRARRSRAAVLRRRVGHLRTRQRRGDRRGALRVA